MIRTAMTSMGFGMLGALLLQALILLFLPPSPRLAQIDLVSIMQTEIEDMAKKKIDGKGIDPRERAAEVQKAVAEIAENTGRVIIVRQALVAGSIEDVPDYTEEVKARLK